MQKSSNFVVPVKQELPEDLSKVHKLSVRSKKSTPAKSPCISKRESSVKQPVTRQVNLGNKPHVLLKPPTSTKPPVSNISRKTGEPLAPDKLIPPKIPPKPTNVSQAPKSPFFMFVLREKRKLNNLGLSKDEMKTHVREMWDKVEPAQKQKMEDQYAIRKAIYESSLDKDISDASISGLGEVIVDESKVTIDNSKSKVKPKNQGTSKKKKKGRLS